MELTRRDAITALVGGSIASGVTLTSSELIVGADDEVGGHPIADAEVDTMVAVADVVYPSEVTGIQPFVTGYVRGLDQEYQTRMSAAAGGLDRQTRRRHGEPFDGLPVSKRDAVLRSLGVDRVQASPDGTLPERIRYYLVNELTYALLTTPKGGRLFGIENPVGYPGGIASYTVRL